MSKILNCPLCRKSPRVQPRDPGYYNLKTYHCCGHAVYADDEVPWNKYAAAMELTIACINIGKEVDSGADDNSLEVLYEKFSNAETVAKGLFK